MPTRRTFVSPLLLIAASGLSWLMGWNGVMFPPMNEPLVKIDNKEKIHITKSNAATNHSATASPMNVYDIDKNQDLDKVVQLKIFRQYQKWHSHEALAQEVAKSENQTFEERKFILAYYSCPYQAGNRLHHFMNAMIWAIVTNRTLLYKYYDKQTCEELGKKYDGRICSFTNTEEACKHVLHRATWIPSFDYWSARLTLPPPTRFDYWVTHFPPNKTSARVFRKYPLKTFYNNASIDVSSDRLIELGQMLGTDSATLSIKEEREWLLQTISARERAEQLFHNSKLLVYGMLFRECFVIDDLLLPPQNQQKTKASFSIALHSRHSSTRDRGDNIEKEIACLQNIWSRLNISSNDPCNVHVMSDRPRTLRALHSYLQDHSHCNMLFAVHEVPVFSFSGEHGPYAGAGFFRDLANCVQARHAFIGSSYRSSSNLIEEILDYDASMRGEENGLIKCYI